MEFQIVMHRGPGMRHGLLGLVVATAMTAAPSTRVSSADDVDKGKALAARLCAACHMNEGQGEKLGLLGVPGFAAVAARPQQTHQGIVRWLQSRPPMMPDHHLSSDEAGALATFILSLRTPP